MSLMSDNNPFSSPNNVLSALEWRYATKRFDPSRRVDQSLWTQLERVLTLSPSSYGLQPYRFVVITDPVLKEELKSHAYGQSQITDCSHLVVFATKTNLSATDVDEFIDLTTAARGMESRDLKGYRDVIVGDLVEGPRAEIISYWARMQAYIALGNLMTAAALLRVDVCPMEGFLPDKFNEVMNLGEQGLHAAVLAAVGYRSADDKYAELKKVRFAPDKLFDRR